MRRLILAVALILGLGAGEARAEEPVRSFPVAPLSLRAYPRPPRDNGLGVHWSTYMYGQSDEATDYFVAELAAMNVTWVKLINDGTRGRDWDRTVDKLVAAGIMPVLRLRLECNDPYDASGLDAVVRHYVAHGVFYYELYNEPGSTGPDGGWCGRDPSPQPEMLARQWADAARVVYDAGGYPGLPSLFAPSKKTPGWRESFFYRFFDDLRAQGNESVLYFSWASIHNYAIDHPPTYPYDEVNLTGRPLTETEIGRYELTSAQVEAINRARAVAREPGGFFLGDNLADDSTCFLHFVAYRDQFHDLFGFDIPLISTEGGARRGSAEDPRYPTVDGRTVAEWTVRSADYMLDDAPPYYFATCTWLLAQRAVGYDAAPWEEDAWYHDRVGGQEPVVPALKARPRRTEVRQICYDDGACRTEVKPPASAVPLTAYPRPRADNGRGVHWAPTNQPESREVVDYFVGEVAAMNLRWVKLLQDDQTDVTHSYLLEQLQAQGIEPILRVYRPFNEAYEHLAELAPKAARLGVHYFELFSEPNVAGAAGGWRPDEPVSDGRIVELWMPAARAVRAAGGYPSLPPLAPGGTVDDMVFLRRFLDGVRARGQVELLVGCWIPLHNYFLNHPLDYPADPVNVSDVLLTPEEIVNRGLTPAQVEAINGARRIAKRPRAEGGFWVGNTVDEDSNGFRKFEAYEHIFRGRLGFDLPIIGTEGGAIEGSAEDPRYPAVTDADVAALTVTAYRVMLDDAPTYFFAQTAWLLANQAGGHPDERFEHAAWYKDPGGTVLPVVSALKSDSRRWETRTALTR